MRKNARSESEIEHDDNEGGVNEDLRRVTSLGDDVPEGRANDEGQKRADTSMRKVEGLWKRRFFG